MKDLLQRCGRRLGLADLLSRSAPRLSSKRAQDGLAGLTTCFYPSTRWVIPAETLNYFFAFPRVDIALILLPKDRSRRLSGAPKSDYDVSIGGAEQ
jgi:hypothetical protein